MSPPVTVVSTKGQVILPKSVRDRHGWRPGARLEVIETEDGVLLRPPAGASRLEEVSGCLWRAGPARSVEEMDAGVLDLAGRDHDWG